jgi:hypothetical protein
MLTAAGGDAMDEKMRSQWNKVRPKIQRHIDVFLDRLFRDGTPFFDRKKLPPILIDEFIKSEEAQFAAFKFIEEARNIWKNKFHGKDIPMSPIPEQLERKSGDAQASASKDIPAAATIPAASPLKPGQIPATTMPPTQPAPFPPPRFQLHNCKAGVEYAEKIECPGAPEIRVDSVKFPDEWGNTLSFDPATQMIRGKVDKAGEFSLPLMWRQGMDKTSRSASLPFIVIPDPRSLWQVNEPDKNLPYQKPHLDQKLIRGNGFTIAAASRRGRSHEHGGTFRDDDFFIEDNAENGWSVLIVADGAGSAKSSRQGSLLAVRAAGDHMVSALNGEFGGNIVSLLRNWDADPASQRQIGEKFHLFFHEAATQAVKAIEQEAESKNAPPKDYATTLLAAAVRRAGDTTFLATFWMGDGAIAAYGPRGKARLMGTPDGGEFAGQTRFLDRNALADQEFGKRIRIGKWSDIIAVLLMTDGVSDPYFETDNGLIDPAKWDGLWDEINPRLNDAAPEVKLLDWLHFFKSGHHDDRTIALLW